MTTTSEHSTVLIRFENLTKKFGAFTAVKNFSLEIYRGEVLGFLGPNGAGKTTTMKMLAYLLRPTEGEIWIRSHGDGELQQLSTRKKDYLLDKIGFLIDKPEFYQDVTPRQILSYFAKLKGYPRLKIPDRVEQVVKMMGLFGWIDKKIGTFSKGMRQKIGIVAAIVHDPDIIVLDEPYTGLDPQARKDVRDFILQLKQQQKTVFLSSHLLYEVAEIADRINIINHGNLIACDSLENLEQMAKNSTIQLQLLENEKLPINPSKTMGLILDCVGSLLDTPPIRYVPDLQLFELLFDGSPQKQHHILKKLMDHKFEIFDFSVPKASLLENLYLRFINESDKSHTQTQKTAIKVESIL
ncbi:MAG: ABC transporter ATP-binding protein [Promethearchaeota archaeon]